AGGSGRGKVGAFVGEGQVGGDDDRVDQLAALAHEVIGKDVEGGEHVAGDGEEALDLAGVQVHGDVAVGAGHFDHIGHQPGGDGHARLVLFIGAGVGHV